MQNGCLTQGNSRGEKVGSTSEIVGESIDNYREEGGREEGGENRNGKSGGFCDDQCI